MKRALVILLACVAAGALSACESHVDTAYATYDGKAGPLWHRKTSTRRTEATETAPASSECDADSGLCGVPTPLAPRAK